MHIKMLIDSIMQQTTILIGQLSTAAGIRAPLARIADQVFVDLAQELESQGVGRRVAADMFGMALRSYQKKLRRLTESQSAADRTLWRAVLEHVRQNQRVRKADLLRRFGRDGEREVGSILADLVSSGLIYQTGRGLDALYRVTSDVDLRHLAGGDDPEALAPLVWSAVHDRPGSSEAELIASLGLDPEATRRALQLLIREGRLRRDAPGPDAPITAEDLVVPVGATQGWEVAVHDHFRAVANAIASKVRSGAARAEGGTSSAARPCRSTSAKGTRTASASYRCSPRCANGSTALWNEVESYNARHPLSEAERKRLFFYFGQYLEDGDTEPDGDDAADDAIEGRRERERVMLERGLRVMAFAGLLFVALACGKTNARAPGTNTNWLGSCEDDGDCTARQRVRVRRVHAALLGRKSQCAPLAERADCTPVTAACGGIGRRTSPRLSPRACWAATATATAARSRTASAATACACRGSRPAAARERPRPSPTPRRRSRMRPAVDPYALVRNDNVVEIGAAYLDCKVDEDCTLVGIGCNGCCQYGAIDEDLRSTYEENFEQGLRRLSRQHLRLSGAADRREVHRRNLPDRGGVRLADAELAARV